MKNVKIHITKLPNKLKNSQKEGFRKKSVKLLTARGRKNSSQRWLQRQLNDPYVQKAKLLGYRCRAAFKIKEILEKFQMINSQSIIVDLGAAPGGWSQIISQHIYKNLKVKENKIFAIDLLEMNPINGVSFIKGDFLDKKTQSNLIENIPKRVSTVLSDMAAVTTGHPRTDHIKTNTLAENAFIFAKQVLHPKGNFICKVFAGGTHKELLEKLQISFKQVKHFKPKSSRKESPETYVVCLDFNG